MWLIRRILRTAPTASPADCESPIEIHASAAKSVFITPSFVIPQAKHRLAIAKASLADWA
jgi:hypothetical protein